MDCIGVLLTMHRGAEAQRVLSWEGGHLTGWVEGGPLSPQEGGELAGSLPVMMCGAFQITLTNITWHTSGLQSLPASPLPPQPWTVKGPLRSRRGAKSRRLLTLPIQTIYCLAVKPINWLKGLPLRPPQPVCTAWAAVVQAALPHLPSSVLLSCSHHQVSPHAAPYSSCSRARIWPNVSCIRPANCRCSRCSSCWWAAACGTHT